MTKLEFLAELEKRISVLPPSDVKKTVDYYTEMLEDYSDDGLDTDTAVKKMGGIDAIASGIINEAKSAEISKMLRDSNEGGEKLDTGAPQKEKNECGKKLLTGLSHTSVGALATVFFILTGVLYLLSAIVIFTCYISTLTLGAASLGVLLAAVLTLINSSSVIYTLFLIGSALVCGALSLIFCAASITLTKGWRKIWKRRRLNKRKEKT